MARVLVACEESQAVAGHFRRLGHEAYSCDVLPTSGDHPEWHVQGDVLPLLDQQWDLVIAFPPCTHLAASGARWFAEKLADGRQQQAINFFMRFVDCQAPRVAIENPVGVMSSVYRKPDCIVEPWQHGHSVRKRTCLWLRGLPVLVPTNVVNSGPTVRYGNSGNMSQWYRDTWNLPPAKRAMARSRTFDGVARAMAEQWSPLLPQ